MVQGIPMEGLIVAVADVFDALTSERPYKKAWTVETAIERVQQDAGKHFDPKLVELFMGVLPQVLAIRERWKEDEAPAV